MNILKGKCIGLLFEEPSSRTYLSFSSAITRLGGTPIPLQLNKSSVLKFRRYIYDISNLCRCDYYSNE